MKLSEIKFKDMNGVETRVQSSFYIAFDNGQGDYVENINIEIAETEDSFPLNRILQLKKSGFESEEIIKLIKEFK